MIIRGLFKSNNNNMFDVLPIDFEIKNVFIFTL